MTRLVLRGARWPGDVAIDGGRITAVGSVPEEAGDQVARVDGDIVTAGLVNTHHHFYQWMTRGWAFDCTLFGWLTTLYPVGEADPEDVEVAVALGELALTGCTPRPTTTTWSRGATTRCSTRSAARTIGIRAHIARGSMDLGQSKGGLRPTRWWRTWTPSSPRPSRCTSGCDGDRIVVTVAPGPFSVTPELMTESAELARSLGLRLHTHLAETLDEERSCLERSAGGRSRSGRDRLDRPRRLGGPRDPLRRRRGAAPGPDRHRDRALPLKQLPARLGHRPGGRPHQPPAPRLGWGSTGWPATRSAGCTRRCGWRCSWPASGTSARPRSCRPTRSGWLPRVGPAASAATTSAGWSPHYQPMWPSGRATTWPTCSTRWPAWSWGRTPGTCWWRRVRGPRR